MKWHWTRYGWVREYTKEEQEKFRKQNEEARKTYVLPTPPPNNLKGDDKHA